MKLAITIWGNRISPVFDAASTLLVAHLEKKTIIKKTYKSFNPETPENLFKILKKMEISVLVCGAISTRPADLIVENGIKLISFVTGDASSFLDNFAHKGTIEKTFMMPGCSKQYCWRSKSKKLSPVI